MDHRANSYQQGHNYAYGQSNNRSNNRIHEQSTEPDNEFNSQPVIYSANQASYIEPPRTYDIMMQQESPPDLLNHQYTTFRNGSHQTAQPYQPMRSQASSADYNLQYANAQSFAVSSSAYQSNYNVREHVPYYSNSEYVHSSSDQSADLSMNSLYIRSNAFDNHSQSVNHSRITPALSTMDSTMFSSHQSEVSPAAQTRAVHAANTLLLNQMAAPHQSVSQMSGPPPLPVLSRSATSEPLDQSSHLLPPFHRPNDTPVLRRDLSGSQSMPLIDRKVDSSVALQHTPSLELSPAGSHRDRKRSRRGDDSQSVNQSPRVPAEALQGLNKDEVKRMKHRSIDAFRRSREAAAVTRLSTWLDTFENGESSSRPPSAREKLTVLEASGAHLEMMLSRAQQLEKHVQDLEDDNSILRLQLHQSRELFISHVSYEDRSSYQYQPHAAVHPYSADRLQNQSVIYQSIFYSSTQLLMVLNVETGRCLDVNPRFVSMCGRTREELLQGRYSWPFVELRALTEPNSISTSERRYQKLIKSSSAFASGCKFGLQHRPENAEALMSLFTGAVEQMQCGFTIRSRDNQSVSVSCICWAGKPTESSQMKGESGGAESQPSPLMSLIANQPHMYQLVICMNESDWLAAVNMDANHTVL